MMSRIDRIRHAFAAHRAGRMRVDGSAAVESAQLPVLIEPPLATARPQRADRRQGEVEFSAQMIGQDGQRRGLRGGSPVLETARTTYNGVEWSGTWDRRARKGRQAKTEA